MASSFFSGIGEAISPAKLKRVSYSSALDEQLDALTKAQTEGRALSAAELARLNEASVAAGKEVEALSPGDMAIIQQIISGNQSRDPLQTYTQVGDYNFGLLDRLASGLAQQGQAGESRKLAAMGYGGRGNSTYQSNTLLDRISKNLTPVYASTMGNIGRDASAIDTGRLNLNRDTLSNVQYRSTIPGRALPYYAAPIEARQSLTQSEIANLLGLGEGYKGNTAGFREQQSALGSVMGSLDSAVDTGLSLYSGGLAGGSGGGMFGGGGGGSKASESATKFQPTNFGPSNYGMNFSYSGQPLTPSVAPSGYQNYGMSYGAWTPPWRN